MRNAIVLILVVVEDGLGEDVNITTNEEFDGS